MILKYLHRPIGTHSKENCKEKTTKILKITFQKVKKLEFLIVSKHIFRVLFKRYFFEEIKSLISRSILENYLKTNFRYFLIQVYFKFWILEELLSY